MNVDAVHGPPAEPAPTGRPRRVPRGAGARGPLLRGARDPSSALLLSQTVVAGGAFVANVFAARALDPSGRGQLAVLLQIAYLSSLGLLLGIDRSAVAVYAGASAGVVTRAVSALLRRPVMVGLVVALLALVVLVALPAAGHGSWWLLVPLAAAFAVVNAFVRSLRAVAIAAGRHRDYARVTLVSQLLLLATMAALLALRVRDPPTWLFAYLVAGALPTALCFRRWLREDGPTPLAGDDRPARVRREGVAVFPAAVADSGMLRFDRLLLAAITSTSALGIYASVATMTELLAWPLVAFADARLGTWRAAHDTRSLRRRRVLLVAVAYTFTAGPALAVVVSLSIVRLLGDAYAPARDLVLPLVAAAGVYGLSQVLVSMLIAGRRGAMASASATTGFVVSVLAYLVLIPDHGAAGAAYGSLIGYGAALTVAAAAVTRGHAQDRRMAAP